MILAASCIRAAASIMAVSAAAAATIAALPDGLLEHVFQALEPPDRQVHARGWRVSWL